MANQLKEHILNRLGYGPGVWQSNRYDALGPAGYMAEQLAGTLAPIPDMGTTIVTKLIRSVQSQRQLEAVLIDFWFNHFNIDTKSVKEVQRAKSIAGRTADHHQNVAIYPYILGDFATMLFETAKSPAMLDYLDNRLNYEEETTANGKVFGGNDNYAREVMELHTVGVDGGYNEVDITEAARIMTGWSVTGDAYAFKSARHDFNAKTVMGVNYPAGAGEEEGAAFLDFLANHSSTPQFLATKLVARFINEVPPPDAVSAVASAYGPGHDLGAMMRTLVDHPAFSDPANFRSKVKPPLRFVSTALSAMGGQTNADGANIATKLTNAIVSSGEVPYVVGPPTGYPEDSAFWVSGASLLERFEVAETIAYHAPLRNRLIARSGVDGSDVVATVDAVAAQMIPGGLSDETRNAVADHMAANAATNNGRISAAAHLVLCSPEFLRF